MKITFLGAGSTIFARNVLGDAMLTPSLQDAHIALYDINAQRLEESRGLLEAINKGSNKSRARISTYCGESQRKEALRGANFIVNAVQVGGYEPATVLDFEIPKKYGLQQTIGDTLGIGGIMRGLRTLPFLAAVSKEIEEVAPQAWFLNYTNPMSILTGYLQRYTEVKTIGLCHSVQICSERLLKALRMEDYLDGRIELIAGINHMGWLLDIRDKQGNDLYPLIKERAAAKQSAGKHSDMVRFEYIRRFGYYCTESSEHNAEYNPYFIKRGYPELIADYNIPLDEYPRRCVKQIAEWKDMYRNLSKADELVHVRSNEYASQIMESIVTGIPYTIGGNVQNNGVIPNLPKQACVEVPCLVNGYGITPCMVGEIPYQLAALNTAHIWVHLLTIEAFTTQNLDTAIQAVLLDPHTAAELSIDDTVAMTKELVSAHGLALH